MWGKVIEKISIKDVPFFSIAEITIPNAAPFNDKFTIVATPNKNEPRIRDIIMDPLCSISVSAWAEGANASRASDTNSGVSIGQRSVHIPTA